MEIPDTSGMTWKTSNVVTERAKFALEYEKRWRQHRGRVNVAELCRIYGVSRETGYVWINRFVRANFDVRALEDRSRRPLTSPHAVSEEMADFIVAMRKQKPKWGPRMLRAWLIDRHPGKSFPSASTFANILKRHGMTTQRKGRRRPRAPLVATSPLGDPTGPNSIWCVDFKGQFKTCDGELCYPLTLVDAFSRYCLRCEACVEPTGAFTQHVLDSAFREFGLPAAIRSDNGSPFAGNGPAGLSQVSVWLLRLGIRLERITPGKPQQNGRQERFHRTLKHATVTPPAGNLRLQQRAFNHFRPEYNDERPHQSLKMKPPASIYVPSTARYPRGLLPHAGDAIKQIVRVDAGGKILWARHRLFISSALAHEQVSVTPDGDTRWLVAFGDVELGHLDEERLEEGFLPKPRPRKAHYLEFERADDVTAPRPLASPRALRARSARGR